MKKTSITLFALFAIFLLVFPLNSANENQNQYMGIKPDSPFYFFQGVKEGFGGLFRGGNPEFHEELAKRRQAEMQYLQEQGKQKLIEKLQLRERKEEHNEKAQQIREQIRKREEGEGADSGKIKEIATNGTPSSDKGQQGSRSGSSQGSGSQFGSGNGQ